MKADCAWVRRFRQHGTVLVYYRSWRRPWRKKYAIVCYGCDLRIEEP